MDSDYPTVLDLIGGTPLVRLDRIARGVAPRVLAKLEHLNPGGSVKDRIGLRMIEEAERTGKLRPGGTIVEPTSGNTGVGLAIAAAIKGYRCVFVMPDKVAPEKIRLLRAYGAEVVICPTAVPPDSPESYYAVSSRLAEEIPGAFKPDQYSNPTNPLAHYETTGPELWEQTGGELDALVADRRNRRDDLRHGPLSARAQARPARRRPRTPRARSTRRRPSTCTWSRASARTSGRLRTTPRSSTSTSPSPTGTPSVTARRLAREEGLLVGGSGGTAVFAALAVARRFGPEATVVTLIPDSGRGYLSKVYDDNWLLEHGILEREAPGPTIDEVLAFKRVEEPDVPELILVDAHRKVGEAIELMQRYGISQLPVVRNEPAASLADVIGSIRERGLLDRVFRNRDALEDDVAQAMEPPLPAIDIAESVDQVFADLSGEAPAVVVARAGRSGRRPHPRRPARVPRGQARLERT